MKDENFITIQGWMVNRLNLSGNDLLCYALIYGFSQNCGWWEASYSYIASWLNISKRGLHDVIGRLLESGYIEKEEYTINGVKYVRYRACVDNFIGGEETSSGGSEETSSHIYSNIDNKEKEDNKLSSSKKDETSILVDKFYAMYPSKCPKRGVSLGKGRKDKERIRQLLKIYSPEDIERVIQHEIDEKYGKQWMRHFSTFLNNFPDPSCLNDGVSTKTVTLFDDTSKDGMVNEKGEVWSEQLQKWLK